MLPSTGKFSAPPSFGELRLTHPHRPLLPNAAVFSTHPHLPPSSPLLTSSLHSHQFVHNFLLMSHKMSIDTPNADQDPPSLFDSLPRRDLNHSSSTHVSPGSMPTHTKQHNPRHVKPPFHMRSRSDQPVLHRKINVISGTDQRPTLQKQSSPASITSSAASVKSLTRNISTAPSTRHPIHHTPATTRSSRPPIKWIRTHSGGLWFARPTDRDRRDLQRSSDSQTSTASVIRPGQNMVPPLPKPMRPPFTRSDASAASGYFREVKLETSFTASMELPPEPLTPPKRRLSLNPKQIFSNTVLLARRFSLRGKLSKADKETSSPIPEDISPNISPIHNLSHSTALRPNKTTSVLQRVTSILSESKTQEVDHNPPLPKIFLNKSDFPPRSTGKRVLRPPALRLTSGAPTVRTPAVSYTSSQRKLRLGSAPTSTPEDKATYKVGDQVFFKVDISIRGGTSYLPSEARRIHTPPLPGEQIHVQGPLGPDGHRFVQMKSREETINHLNATKLPDMERALTRDWYDLQLSLLESEARPAVYHDVSIDYEIPEHLPTSPLCPRNDRYWRYVQEKLKPGEEKHRVCWMHGMRDD